MRCKTCKFCKPISPVKTHECIMIDQYIDPNNERCESYYVQHSNIKRKPRPRKEPKT